MLSFKEFFKFLRLFLLRPQNILWRPMTTGRNIVPKQCSDASGKHSLTFLHRQWNLVLHNHNLAPTNLTWGHVNQVFWPMNSFACPTPMCTTSKQTNEMFNNCLDVALEMLPISNIQLACCLPHPHLGHKSTAFTKQLATNHGL